MLYVISTGEGYPGERERETEEGFTHQHDKVTFSTAREATTSMAHFQEVCREKKKNPEANVWKRKEGSLNDE